MHHHHDPFGGSARFEMRCVGRVERLMAGKYRVDMVFIKPVRSVQAALHRGRPRGKPVILAITPA